MFGNGWTKRYSELRIELSKQLMGIHTKDSARKALKLNRANLRKVTGLVNGHCNLKKHIHNMGLTEEDLICRLCNEDDETVSHIILECEALANDGTHKPAG